MKKHQGFWKGLSVGIVLLFLSGSIVSSVAQVTEKTSVSLSRGTWLYVGGSGPGNYTRIQDAINNTNDGDTVFVYDDSSPYYEHIEINTSISLLGENKNTTIIDGSKDNSSENLTAYFGILIHADDVVVRDLTVQDYYFSGICITSNHTIISNMIISGAILKNNENYGIIISSENTNQTLIMSADNTITNNVITNNMIGIGISGQKNIIRENIISQKSMGIAVMFSMNCNISNNIISKDTTGVYLSASYNTVIYRNNISYNGEGIGTMWTSSDKILQNNFIGNNVSGSSVQMFLIQLYYKYKGELSYPLRRNIWNENYWDGPRSLPYKSPGILWFIVDWHPAQEPYDI